MSKKFLSVILAFLMLLSVLLTACVTSTPPSTEPTAASTPKVSPTETPSESPTDTPEASPSETEPTDDPDEPVIKPTAAGTLWYYEDFEDEELSTNSSKVLSSLGWYYAEGGNTARYAIAKKDGSKQLKITNNISGGSDSYVYILGDGILTYLHTLNYTYQYDVTYTGASSVSRYINIVSEYDDGDYYNSFHFRNGGYAHNQTYSTSWSNYDPSAHSTEAGKSIAYRLLGKDYNGTQLFNNICVSIRYVVNWESGNKIYMRVNTEGYPTTGEWVLVSSFNDDSSKDWFDKDVNGNALVLKVGGKQNGYIDNIMVWCGTTKEPTSTENAYLSTDTACHRIIEVYGRRYCVICGKTEADIESDPWLLDTVPEYEGGRQADNVYLAGQGIGKDQLEEDEARTIVISGTNKTEFEAYLAKLAAEGYTLEYSRDADSNLFRSYVKDGRRIYTYLMSRTGEVRIISESTATSSSIDEISYPYTPAEGERTELYQFGLPNRDAEHTAAEGYVVNGMLYIFKLADDSVILVDGGESCQWTDERVDALMAFLRRITDTPEGEGVKIAAWYITHIHSDHLNGIRLFLKKYNKSVTVERLITNAPSFHGEQDILSKRNGNMKNIAKELSTYYGNTVKHIKLHTGMVVSLGSVELEVLYTHDDLVDPITGISKVGGDFNETNTVSLFRFEGKTMAMLGDINVVGERIMLKNWSESVFKSDIVQISHHSINDVDGLYSVIKAPALLVPTSKYSVDNSSSYTDILKAAKEYADTSMIFFQGTSTIGLAVENGKLVKILDEPTIYGVRK